MISWKGGVETSLAPLQTFRSHFGGYEQLGDGEKEPAEGMPTWEVQVERVTSMRPRDPRAGESATLLSLHANAEKEHGLMEKGKESKSPFRP